MYALRTYINRTFFFFLYITISLIIIINKLSLLFDSWFLDQVKIVIKGTNKN